MNNDMQELIKFATVRTKTIKLDCLKNTNFKDMEFLLKEMNISETKKYNELLRIFLKDKENEEFINYACKAVMVKPSFFTEDELKNLNGIGKVIIEEIFKKIPTIGMTDADIENYFKQIAKAEKEELDDKPVKNELIEAYKNDKKIVDGLKSDDLKILCNYLDIKYTNVTNAKKALKSNKPLDDKESKEEADEVKK